MFGVQNWGLFVASALLLNITPGADMLYVLSRASSQGARAGAAAALGIATGCLIHTTLAVAGLSAILATSAVAFQIVKYAGALYLAYFGLMLLLKARQPAVAPASNSQSRSLPRVYRQAILINALNPKVALFFLAFLPQFIAAGSFHRVMAFVLLGATFNATSTLVNVSVACTAASVRRRLSRGAYLARWLRAVLGGAFVALGVKLALSTH